MLPTALHGEWRNVVVGDSLVLLSAGNALDVSRKIIDVIYRYFFTNKFTIEYHPDWYFLKNI